MSGELQRGSLPASGSSTPRCKVDALSREDLIRFAKKQVEKLKLLRAENTAFGQRISETQSAFESLRTENKELEIAVENEKLKADISAKEIKQLTEENEVLKELLREKEQQIKDYDVQLKSLEDLSADQTQRLAKYATEKDELTCTVMELRSFLDDANNRLNVAKEQRNAENIFSLEIADYEKTVDRLQKELDQVTKNCQNAEADRDSYSVEMKALKNEKELLESKLNKMKAVVKKLKSELDGKKESIMTAEKTVDKLQEALKKLNAERDDEKLKISAVLGENRVVIQRLGDKASSLDRQVANLKTERESLLRQLDDAKLEHSQFKNRALYVLEQKQEENSDKKNEELELLEGKVRHKEQIIDSLTKSHKLLEDELCSVQENYLTVVAKVKDLERDLSSSNSGHQKELSELREMFESRLASEIKVNGDLTAKINANFLTYSREKEHVIAEAKREREVLLAEIEQLKQSVDEERRRRVEAEQYATSSANIVLSKTPSAAAAVNKILFQRPNVLGKETITSNDDGMHEKTLEEVLNDVDTDHSRVDDISHWKENDAINWEEVAIKCQKMIEHTRELLNESESTNVRLIEQTKLLKEEIRRMQRNEERSDHLTNNEYLKNVILKFIAPEKVSSERGQLIPVLATMLRLSTDEVNSLKTAIEDDVSSEAETKTAAWGSYFHRWSGFS
ncbi:hypothetical protein AB6A40_006891 [Gnathostoma spinigerum]|uniref:GRIP domain-containing protein n=1 Tax=Gnathostoma spinigerum TaxID=75299 RepID=A0ABD6EUE1_9BILA